MLADVVFVNFVHQWRALMFKIDSEWQICEQVVMTYLFIFLDFYPEIC